MDTFTRKQRSQVMSRIRSQDTGLERRVLCGLRSLGLHFTKNYSKIPGRPDIAFPQKKLAIFIDSDFWHGWQYPRWKQRLPNSYWRNKIERNRKRDRYINQKLAKIGWRVLRYWEHEINHDENWVMTDIARHVQ